MAQSTGESEKTSTSAALSSAALAARSSSSLHLAGSKLRKQLSGSLQEHVSAPTSAFARKQLEKMGWSDGTGLGKKRDGIKTHIKVTKRKDQEGLGAEKAATIKHASSEQWWKDSLGDTLARLSAKKGKKSDKKSKKRKEYTDEELFEATGGSRFGMRAGITKNLGKWRRTEGEGELEETAKVSVEEGVDDSGKGTESAEVNGLPLVETVSKKEKKKDKSAKKAKKAKREVKVKVATEEKKKNRKDKKDKKKKSSSREQDEE
jgi:Pin2-interacting protein X1